MQWLTPCRSINASSIESISARRQLFRQAHCPAEDIAIYMEWKINVNLKMSESSYWPNIFQSNCWNKRNCDFDGSRNKTACVICQADIFRHSSAQR
ncbi:hypothetical protein HA40_01780 [Mixta calida]|nr:hypothetical protein HA40_01780 [Mixta calida]